MFPIVGDFDHRLTSLTEVSVGRVRDFSGGLNVAWSGLIWSADSAEFDDLGRTMPCAAAAFSP